MGAEGKGESGNGGKGIVSWDDDEIVSSFEGDDATTPSDIVIKQGDLYLTTTGEKAHGLKSDQGIIINGGLVQATVKGNAHAGGSGHAGQENAKRASHKASETSGRRIDC